MRASNWTTSSACLLLAFVSFAAAPAYAQGSQRNETDAAFVSRIQAQLSRIEQRAEELEDVARSMASGLSTSSSRYGTNPATSGSRSTSARMQGDPARARSDLRSLIRRLQRTREELEEHYRQSDEDDFDRRHWEGVARRLELELERIQRNMQRY